MKKALFFGLSILFLWASSQAQTANFREVIYLKNGSILKGTITEWIPDESLSIQLSDSSLFVCKISDIQKVKREWISDASKGISRTPVAPNVNGYESNISGGYGVASGKYGLDILCFNWVFGKNLNTHHFVGMGTGLRYMEEVDMTMVPILLDWRYRITEQSVSPYVRLSAGYSLNVSSGLENSGFLVDPRIGVDFQLGVTRCSFDMGYQTQQTAFWVLKDPLSNPYLSKVYRFSEALKFSFGISF